MELDLPMMEIGYVFQKTLEGEKTLHKGAKKVGVAWLKKRIETSAKVRWNPIRKKALDVTASVANYLIANSQEDEITAAELSAVLRLLDGPDRKGLVRFEECPF